jgi:predicted membrane channel-forming protein YqfA (hemolysin III family)
MPRLINRLRLRKLPASWLFRQWRETAMEDFPIWLKLVIWLVVGGTIVYVVGAVVYTVMTG